MDFKLRRLSRTPTKPPQPRDAVPSTPPDPTANGSETVTLVKPADLGDFALPMSNLAPRHLALLPDRALQPGEPDLLHRTAFAGCVAQSIATYERSEGLVIGIFGPWGSGKSSVWSLIRHDLELRSPAIKILEFQPWQWSGEDRLSRAFFDEIERKIFGRRTKNSYLKAQHYWDIWKARLALATALSSTGASAPIDSKLLALILAVTIISPLPEWLRILVAVLGLVFLVSGRLLTYLHMASEKLAELRGREAASRELPFDELRDRLRSAFAKLDATTLVVLDDVDRLLPDEVAQLMRLVKANADLPKLIFLVLADHGHLCKQLETGSAIDDAAAWLQKIIQVQLPLPLSDPSDVEAALEARLSAVFGQPNEVADFETLADDGRDIRRWERLKKHLLPYCGSLRDVLRLENSLRFYKAAVTTAETLDINCVDLVALEALRVFEPAVWTRLGRHRVLLSGAESIADALGSFTVVSKDEIREQLKSEILSTTNSAESARSIVRFLFPLFECGANAAQDRRGQLLRERRISHPRHFRRYFRLDPDLMGVTTAESNRIVGELRDPVRARRVLETESRNRLEQVLDTIEGYAPQLSETSVVNWLRALFDLYDRTAGEPMSNSFGTIRDQLAGYICRTLRDWTELEAARERALLAAVRSTTGVFLPMSVVYVEERRLSEEGRGMCFGDECVRARLIPEVLRLIAAAAQDGRLAQETDLGRVMVFWQRWDPEACKEWARDRLAATDAGLVALVDAFAAFVPSGELRLDMVRIGSFVAIPDALRRLELVDPSALTDLQRRVVSAFIAAGSVRKNEVAFEVEPAGRQVPPAEDT